MPRKVHDLFDDKNILQGYAFHCPGCKYAHVFYTKEQHKDAPVWTFNGDVEKPTFRASLLNYQPETSKLCHLFVTDGKIEYLSDSSHHLAGKTVEMEDIK